MATTEQRIGDLAEKHLGISDRSLLDANVGDLGVNSVDAVRFSQGRQPGIGNRHFTGAGCRLLKVEGLDQPHRRMMSRKRWMRLQAGHVFRMPVKPASEC